MIVSGGCTLAERYAADNDLELTVFKPDMKQHTHFKCAARARNLRISDKCDIMIAFPDTKKGKGTQMAIGMAMRKGKRVFVVEGKSENRKIGKRS